MRNSANLICVILVILGANTVTARKEVQRDQTLFFSEKNFRAAIKEKSEESGVCRRKIQFTFHDGPTQDNVYVPCYDDYDESNDGEQYVISRILYSENPKKAVIITHTGNCVKYYDNGGSLAGPETMKGFQCLMIKLKVGAGPFSAVSGILNKINPSKISGSTKISGSSNVSGSSGGSSLSKLISR